MKKQKNIEKPLFSAYKDFSDKRKRISESNIFGMFFSFVIFITSLIRALYSVGVEEKISLCMMLLGGILFLLAVICPVVYNIPLRYVQKIVNRVGKIIIIVLIFPVFLFISLMSLLTKKKILPRYSFEQWQETYNKTLSFEEFRYSDFMNKKSPLVTVIYNLFVFFASNSFLFLLPAVIILLCLGFVFFFLSTSSVFSFVYTLF